MWVWQPPPPPLLECRYNCHLLPYTILVRICPGIVYRIETNPIWYSIYLAYVQRKKTHPHWQTPGPMQYRNGVYPRQKFQTGIETEGVLYHIYFGISRVDDRRGGMEMMEDEVPFPSQTLLVPHHRGKKIRILCLYGEVEGMGRLG